MSKPLESFGDTYRVHAPAAAAHHGEARPAWKPYKPSTPNPTASRPLAELLGVLPAGATPLQEFKHIMGKHHPALAGERLNTKRRARTHSKTS